MSNNSKKLCAQPCLRRSSLGNRSLKFIGILLVLILAGAVSFAQEKNPQRGFQPGNAYALSDIETINTTNGNLMLTFPLGQLAPGRNGLGGGISLHYNSKLYNSEVAELLDASGQLTSQNRIVASQRVGRNGGWDYTNPLNYRLEFINRADVEGGAQPCNANGGLDTQKVVYIWKVKVVYPDGAEREFRPAGYNDALGDGYFNVNPSNGEIRNVQINGNSCGVVTSGSAPNPLTYFSTDSTYTRLIITRGTGWTLSLPDGNRVVSNGGGSNNSFADYFYDRNNSFLSKGTVILPDGQAAFGLVDQFGRYVVTRENPALRETYIYSLGFNNQSLVWTVKWKTIHVLKPYQTTGASSGRFRGASSDQTYKGTWDVVDRITLPSQLGNLSYQFSYNAPDYVPGTPEPTTPSVGWGEVSGITFPSGLQVSYQYNQDGTPELFPNTRTVLDNYVKQKMLSYQAEYDGTVNPITETWTYSISGTHTSSTITGPDGGVTRHFFRDTTFVDGRAGQVYKVIYPNGEVIERDWQPNRPPTSVMAINVNGEVGASVNPYVKTEFRSIPNAAGNLTWTAIKAYSYDKNGNVTRVSEYDWVPYSSYVSAGGIPPGTVPSRVSITTYANATPDATDINNNSAGAYWNSTAPTLRVAQAATEVQNGNGQPFGRAEFTYDDPFTKGNLTLQRSWDSSKGGHTSPLLTTNSISISTQYNQFGLPTLTIDARGFQTEFLYEVVGSVSDLYPTQVKIAFATSVQRTETRTYDFNTGVPTRVTDVDNNVATSTGYDVIGRPVLVRAAEGKPEETRTATEYSDLNRRVTTRSDLNTVGDGKLVTIQHYDQLGRIRLARQLEDASTQSATDETTGIKVQTRYLFSGSNSYVLTSNPYRAGTSGAATEGTTGWTRTKTDNVGRVVEVQTFGGASLPAPWGANTAGTGTVTSTYDANLVTVADQIGNQRKSVTDGLGRLIQVYEAPDKPSFNYLTSYAYDVRDNLTKVTQGDRLRFFMYDSLSRLIRAKNPEQDVRPGLNLTDPLTGNSQWCMAYQYDNNGNLTKKTDARGVETIYVYDALNRNTTVDYSDTTDINPDITRVYDTATNGKGRLRESFKGGNETAGATVEHTKIVSYDALGRPLDQRPRFKSNSVWSAEYKTQRAYNRAGGVISQTYPSGHTINYGYDNAGRVNSFTGNVGDGVSRTYATAITYSVFGGTQQEQFGTQTPLFHKLHYNVRGQLNDIRLSTVSWQTDQWNWNRGGMINYYSQAEVACQTHQCRANSGPLNNGNVVQAQHWVPANDQITSYNFTEDRYTYDSLNRLKSITEYHGTPSGLIGQQDFTQMFDYDQWGNRTINPATTNAPETQFTVLANNRLGVPAGQNKRMDYDAAGNLVNDTYTSYGRDDGTPTRLYDAENRLTTAKDGNLQVVASYSYNADGQRTRRIVGGVETWQVYGMDGELLAEYSSGSATFVATKEYGYRNGQLLVTVSSGDDQRLKRFVQHLYYGALQRDPTSQELTDKTNELATAGAQSQAQLIVKAKDIARSLFVQTNYETSPYRSDTQYVTDLYYTYLQRGPDAAGLGWWTPQAAGSVQNRINVLNAFEASGEFETLVNTLYGAATSDSQRTENYVTNFYQGALARPPDANELATNSATLNSAAAQGQSQVISAAETMGRNLFAAQVNDASLSNTQYVTNLYEGFLQRGPDAGGLGWWSGQATVGQGRQNVLNAFAASSAFRELAGTLYREAYWLVGDHLGTPRMVVNKSGTLAGVKRHDYLPFGEELGLISGRTQAMGYSAIDNVRQKFTQKERDNETGLDYFLARYYSSTQGRFTSPDEFTGGPDELYTFVDDAADNPTFYADVTNPQSLNKYHYVLNNPTRYTDDDGHCGVLCVAAGRIAVGVAARAARTPAGKRFIDKAGAATTTAIVAASGAAQKAYEWASTGNTEGDAFCRACGSSQRMGQALMKGNEQSGGQGQQQGQQEGQSTNYQPNPKHDGPKGDDRRGVSPQPQAGSSLYDSAIQVKPGQRVAVDQSTGKFVVYRTDPNGQTHGYETTWKGLRNDQRAALQKADLVTKRGKIRPPTEEQR